jgi:hypothetical protein
MEVDRLSDIHHSFNTMWIRHCNQVIRRRTPQPFVNDVIVEWIGHTKFTSDPFVRVLNHRIRRHQNTPFVNDRVAKFLFDL